MLAPLNVIKIGYEISFFGQNNIFLKFSDGSIKVDASIIFKLFICVPFL